jgi:hypothetical protein
LQRAVNTKYQFGSHRQSVPKAIRKTEISPIMTYGGLRGSNAPDIEVICNHQFFVMGILPTGISLYITYGSTTDGDETSSDIMRVATPSLKLLGPVQAVAK